MNRKEENIVLRAKTINDRYCDSECPFITEFKDSNSESCYACTLFGGLITEFENMDITEEDNGVFLSWVELPVRSDHCSSVDTGRR